MKILFDENVPYPLKKFLAGHVVSTVQECGWRGVGNGELLNLAEESFDVFILADKNMRYQQKNRWQTDRDCGIADKPLAVAGSFGRSHRGGRGWGAGGGL